MPAAVGIERGCGLRQEGACYSECGLSEYGTPWKMFLQDPPKPVDLTAWGVSAIGVSARTIGGTTHIVDLVGAEHYPNVTDFLEEFARYGMSRRIPKTFDFSQLTTKSTHILIHARAYIENFSDYYADGQVWDCPKHLGHHQITLSGELGASGPPVQEVPREMCAGLWWNDLTGGDPIEGLHDRGVIRTIPACRYRGLARPPGVEPSYNPAIFAVFPITNISIIRARDGSHQTTWEQIAAQTELDVLVQDA